MQKVKTCTWQVGIIVYIGVCLIALSSIAWADGHLQIKEKEQKLVLKGKISEALGEYDSHLKGAVEYLVCGHNGKEYESIVVVDATAKEIYEALEKLSVEVGTPPGYDEEKDEPTPPKGTEFLIYVEWKDGDKAKKVRAEELIYNIKTKKPMQQVAWIYSGSRVVADLDSDDEDAMIPQAFMSNDLVALKRFDASALFQNPLAESEEENIYKKNDALMPKLGTPVMLTIEVNRKMQLFVLISGKVQGVGFRNFTQMNAKQLGINGYAKNLPNGKVEVVAEGDKAQLDALVAFLKKGPRFARVDSLDVDERSFTGEYKTFGIRY
ncbi:MAG: acylphosphatase [Candidatus Poribacteria bacterium]|nr:acylphosphatase [Candidatus Poribacteria bacterium]